MRLALLTVGVLLFPGCWVDRGPTIVVYSALDREFAEPVLKDFERASGTGVLPKYDDESTKTVGLTNAILQEASRPRCDVFWNNEILNTIRLQEKGLLEPYRSPAGEVYPPLYRAADGTWHGFAARARILIVNTKLVGDDERPKWLCLRRSTASFQSQCWMISPGQAEFACLPSTTTRAPRP